MMMVVTACNGSSASRQELDRQEITTTLETFLPLLGEAYASGEFAPLADWAAEKEVSGVRKRVEDLALAGRRLVPTFRSLTIEEIDVWNYSNAYVTSHEVWDLVVYASGTDQVLSQELEQPNRVKYQLKREGGRWRILFRQIQG